MKEEETIDRLLKNYFNARKSWEGWCFLNNLDLETNKPEIRKYADENELLDYVRYLLSKDLHIELYKIIRDSESSFDNIFKLLRTNNTPEADLHLTKLKDFEIELKSLTDPRDKFYAHLDPDYKKFLKRFKVDIYCSVFELIEQAIIILGKENELLALLKTIQSRNDFELKTENG